MWLYREYLNYALPTIKSSKWKFLHPKVRTKVLRQFAKALMQGTGLIQNIPVQRNSWDYGVFLCMVSTFHIYYLDINIIILFFFFFSMPDAKHSIWTSFFLRYQSLTLQLATHLSMVFLSVFRMILLILDWKWNKKLRKWNYCEL